MQLYLTMLAPPLFRAFRILFRIRGSRGPLLRRSRRSAPTSKGKIADVAAMTVADAADPIAVGDAKVAAATANKAAICRNRSMLRRDLLIPGRAKLSRMSHLRQATSQ